MQSIIGTYDCKIDAKGRISVPSGLKKQLPAMADGFVLKKSVYEKCIELWPMAEWNRAIEEIDALSKLDRDNDMFIRRFMYGVRFVEIDDAGRLLVNKEFIDYAGIKKDVVLTSKIKIIEIWDKAAYESLMTDDSADFAQLVDKVMTKKIS